MLSSRDGAGDGLGAAVYTTTRSTLDCHDLDWEISAQWDQRLTALWSYLLEEASAPSAQEKVPHAGASSPQGE